MLDYNIARHLPTVNLLDFTFLLGLDRKLTEHMSLFPPISSITMLIFISVSI